jgi:hypothetical protein
MPQLPRESDSPAVCDEEIFLEAADRLRISMEAMGENVTNAIADLEFEDGQQWPDDLYNQRKLDHRPTLTINHTRTFVRRVVNNMRQQRPRIKVHPVGDGAQVEDAKVVGGMIRHIETRSKASVAYDGGGESAVKIGWGYWRILSEWVDERSFDQELKVAPVRNVFTVYDDPACLLPTGADRGWAFLSELMQRAEYKRKYPNAKNVEWKEGGPGDQMRLWESKEQIRLAEYFRVTKKVQTLYKLTTGKTKFASEMEPGDIVAMDRAGHKIQRQSFERVIEWFRLNGQEVVERQTLPGKWIPLIRCLGNLLDLNGQIRLRGMVRDIKDSNRMYNYWATCETELVALAPRAPWVVAQGQTDGHPEWKDANQRPYSTLTYTVVHSNPDDPNSPPVPPPMRVEAVPIPAGVMNARQGAEHDMMALAGMPHEPGQDTPGTVVSGVALRRRQALSDIGHFQYYDNQTQAISHTGEILLDLIPHYYSEERMQRIIGEDGVPQTIAINQPQPKLDDGGAAMVDPQTGQAIHTIKNDLTVGKYDVVMDTGPGYETKRQEGQEAVIDLMKTPLGEPIVKVGADLIVRNMDFAGADDLADRLLPTSPQGMDKAVQNLPKEAQSIVKALQTQLQQAQQLIQHQAMEIKYKTNIEEGWMKVEREKVQQQSETKLHDTSINAQTKVFDTHVKSTTARDVAEIQAGASLLNTHAEAAHNKEAAQLTLKAAEKAESKKGAGRE